MPDMTPCPECRIVGAHRFDCSHNRRLRAATPEQLAAAIDTASRPPGVPTTPTALDSEVASLVTAAGERIAEQLAPSGSGATAGSDPRKPVAAWHPWEGDENIDELNAGPFVAHVEQDYDEDAMEPIDRFAWSLYVVDRESIYRAILDREGAALRGTAEKREHAQTFAEDAIRMEGLGWTPERAA